MRVYYFLLNVFFILLFSLQCYGQNKYFVAFCADEGAPGHAFISYGYESDDLKMTVHGGTWGQYSDSQIQGALSPIIGNVPGGLRDDMLRDSDHTMVLQISKNQYDEVISIKEKWENKSYKATSSDCLTFVIEVATIFSDTIKLPSRSGLENFPAKYLVTLIGKNS